MGDTEFNLDNYTNDTTLCNDTYNVPDTLYRKVFGTIIFVIVWPFVVLDMKWFPLGRPAAALIGATLMVVFVVVPQDQVYYVVGSQENIQTLFLLLGMMIMSYYYDREGLLKVISLWIFGYGKPLSRILWKVCVITAVFSAIVTNDATCLVLTPLILKEHIKQERHSKEIPPLLLGIATSANIGSAATFFGNPQNAYIAANANISLVVFFATSMPAAVVGLALSVGLLHLIYFPTIFPRNSTSNTEQNMRSNSHFLDEAATGLSASRNELAQSMCLHHRPDAVSEIAIERSRLYSSFHSGPTEHSTPSLEDAHDVDTRSLPANFRFPSSINRGCRSISQHEARSRRETELVSGISQQEITLPQSYANGDHLLVGEERTPLITRSRRVTYRKYTAKVFKICLVIITVIMVGLLIVPPQPSLRFNLGLVPMGAAILTMLADTILNGTYAYDAMTKVDWTVLLLFGGLFVWLQGVENTGFSEAVFNKIKKVMNLSNILGVAIFTIFVVIGSNVLSNVPLVVLLAPKLDSFYCSGSENELCSSQLSGLLLAWVSTIAGNFTLIGSVANLIVAEKAHTTVGYRLTFFGYLKFGFVSTLVVLVAGLPVVYFTANNIHL